MRETISKWVRAIHNETKNKRGEKSEPPHKNAERPPNNTIRRGLCQAESGGKDGFLTLIEMRSIFPLTIEAHFGILDTWSGNEMKRLFHRGER